MRSVLRAHQAAAIEQLREAIRRGSRRIVLSAPTGSGKTTLAAAVTELALARGNRVWFIVPSIVLAWQAAESFEREGIDCRVLQGDRDEGDADAGVTIATIQTATRRKLPLPKILIVDEAHLWHGAHTRLADAVSSDGWVIGLSATAFGKRVRKALPKVISPTSIAALTKAGVLAPARIVGLGDVDLSTLKVVRGDYDEAAMAALFDRDPEIAATVAGWISRGENRSTIAYAASVSHAERLAAGFRAAGISAEAVSGENKPAHRDAVLGRLKSGETRVVTNCQLLVAGFDHPSLGALILARATASPSVWMQAAGRVLRSAPGKTDGLILDFGRNAERLGLPAQLGPDGSPIGDLPVRCAHCSIVAQPVALTCSACGNDREPTPRDLERWHGSLLRLAADRRHSPAWAAHRYRERFGQWPPRRLPEIPDAPSPEVVAFINCRIAAWRAGRAA